MRQAPICMVEGARTAPYQGKPIRWAQSQPARRARKRRWTKVPFQSSHNNSQCPSPRCIPATSNTTPFSNPPYVLEQIPLPALPPTEQLNSPSGMQQQCFDQNSMGYRNIQEGMDGNFELDSVPQQVSQAGPSWQSSLVSYTLPSDSQISQPFYNFDLLPRQNVFGVYVADQAAEGWHDVNFSNNSNLDQSRVSALDIPFDSLENMNSLPGSTSTSPESDGYMYPLMTTTGTEPSQGMNAMPNVDLSDAYFHIGQSIYPPSSDQQAPNALFHQDAISLGNDGLQAQMDVINLANSTFSESRLCLIDDTMAKQNYNSQPIPIPHVPWMSEQLPLSRSRCEEGFESISFNPQPLIAQRIVNGDSDQSKENYAEDAGRKNEFLYYETPATPPCESDNDSWIICYPKNYTPRHSSPGSSRLVRSKTCSPRQTEVDNHGHVFTSFSRISKPKAPKGRQRNLTQLEKKQAREVRDAKACWACHISKTKCSPCSPGSPCEQCARLVGKRRFCKFDCFNDPLESLYILLVPNYLTGHFTRHDVDTFIARNAKGWGNKKIFIRMNWGHRRLLEAEVVTLELRSERSEMAFHHSTKRHGLGGPLPTLLKQQGPPLGIPLPCMDDLEDIYSKYVRGIVQNDLAHYVPVGYFPNDSKLAKRLLGVVSSFYTMGSEADSGCEILREAIEMHVTLVILEKSLALDPESMDRVENHLQQKYPKKPVARCVQRQIKLALFTSQQKRIDKVLKDWGNMMWTIGNAAGNDNRWAVSFSVFMILILVMDKISASAQIFCEDQIRHYGADLVSERAKVRELVNVTETQLFDRCKEIFHWKFKTRKGGKEACNPIRDGMEAFRGRPVSREITKLTFALQSVIRDFGKEIRYHSSLGKDDEPPLPYTDVGRLASIFLDDFLDH